VNILNRLTAYLTETDFASLPADVVEITRKQVLDTLAATVAGTTCSVAGEMNGLFEMVRDWGGKEESTILGFGGRVPAPNAALVNAVSSVRLDFDDTLVTFINLHASRVILPVAMAMAERQGNISGRELITAVALGFDIDTRLKQASGGNHDFPLMISSNFFGAAAVAARLLKLDKKKSGNALFLAMHQMCGAGATEIDGESASSGLKGLSNGLAAKAGIVGALLAEKGFMGSPSFLEPENKSNYYATYCGGSYQPWLLTKDLGKTYAASEAAQKEYPCCHGQHASIEAAMSVMREHNLKPEDVAEVTLRISQFDSVILAEPLERKRDPRNVIETQFSLCWGVASAIVLGRVDIDNFSAKALHNAKIREMAHKVTPKVDNTMTREYGFKPAVAEIKTKDGKVYSKQVDAPWGTPGNSMSFDDIVKKFGECCKYSVRPIPVKNQNAVIKLVQNLEEVEDAGSIARLLG